MARDSFNGLFGSTEKFFAERYCQPLQELLRMITVKRPLKLKTCGVSASLQRETTSRKDGKAEYSRIQTGIFCCIIALAELCIVS